MNKHSTFIFLLSISSSICTMQSNSNRLLQTMFTHRLHVQKSSANKVLQKYFLSSNKDEETRKEVVSLFDKLNKLSSVEDKLGVKLVLNAGVLCVSSVVNGMVLFSDVDWTCKMSIGIATVSSLLYQLKTSDRIHKNKEQIREVKKHIEEIAATEKIPTLEDVD